MVINKLGAYLFLLLKVKNIQFPISFETLAAISYKTILNSENKYTLFLNVIFFTTGNTAGDVSFLKHYHTPVIHFGMLHYKNDETLFLNLLFPQFEIWHVMRRS